MTFPKLTRTPNLPIIATMPAFALHDESRQSAIGQMLGSQKEF